MFVDWFPRGLCHPPMTASSLSLAVDVHMYGGERHDSGVDMSEPPNSLVSSCRSSPCNGDDIFHCTVSLAVLTLMLHLFRVEFFKLHLQIE